MNGEIYQICKIVSSVKMALQNSSTLSYVPLQYEGKLEFSFLPSKGLFRKKEYKAKDIHDWYHHCKELGLINIKCLVPLSVNKRSLLGFSNTTQSCIVCFYDNRTTYFTARWDFDAAKSMWHILYTEHEWATAPVSPLHFENTTESFKKILLQIRTFADEIGFESFANIFQNAHNILSGTADYTYGDIPFPEMPEANLRLFKAASTADVFGAMGSWNDSPPYAAHEKGLDTEYESLSDELLMQVRLAILYAVNEW